MSARCRLLVLVTLALALACLFGAESAWARVLVSGTERAPSLATSSSPPSARSRAQARGGEPLQARNLPGLRTASTDLGETARGTRAERGQLKRFGPGYVVTDPGTGAERTFRIFTDRLGSVRLVVDASSGAVAQEITYDAWGNAVVAGEPELVPFGYAGGLYDRDTGLVRFGARDYDPAVGRWTTRDPIGFAGGDVNLYAYVGGDPVNGVDPNGQARTSCGSSPEACLAIIAAAGGGASPVISQIGDAIARDPAGAANALQSAVSCPAQIAEAVGDLFSSGPPQSVPHLRSLTANNFRENLARLTGGIPKGAQAHHVLPQKFGVQFAQAGLNINDPRFGAWWGAGHQSAASAYNAAWESFLRTSPSPSSEQILQFAREISATYGLSIGF